jgi:hypothetical protein
MPRPRTTNHLTLQNTAVLLRLLPMRRINYYDEHVASELELSINKVYVSPPIWSTEVNLVLTVRNITHHFKVAHVATNQEQKKGWKSTVCVSNKIVCGILHFGLLMYVWLTTAAWLPLSIVFWSRHTATTEWRPIRFRSRLESEVDKPRMQQPTRRELELETLASKTYIQHYINRNLTYMKKSCSSIP